MTKTINRNGPFLWNWHYDRLQGLIFVGFTYLLRIYQDILTASICQCTCQGKTVNFILQVNLGYLSTSNARLRTRSALSRRSVVSRLSVNYLFTEFQKMQWAYSCCVFLSSSSRHLSSAFWGEEGRTCRTSLIIK